MLDRGPIRRNTTLEGGEASLIFEQAMLERLDVAFPTSAAALRAATTASLTSDWRVMSVSVTDGCDGVGILGAVCLPLTSVPLMNVSTLDQTFLLFQDRHAERALRLLKPHFSVESDAASA